tara:strand:+ start:156 stop:281 length:126 start_codon:yes stop_codon:yes gene_type:complete
MKKETYEEIKEILLTSASFDKLNKEEQDRIIKKLYEILKNK